MSKVADLNQLVQGGQLYWAFPFSKGSLLSVIIKITMLRIIMKSIVMLRLMGPVSDSFKLYMTCL